MFLIYTIFENTTKYWKYVIINILIYFELLILSICSCMVVKNVDNWQFIQHKIGNGPVLSVYYYIFNLPVLLTTNVISRDKIVMTFKF